MNKELLNFNGIDATTGEYLQSPMSISGVSLRARGEAFDSTHLAELKARKVRESQQFLGTIEGIDPKDLAQTGWGVIFAFNHAPAIREALAPPARVALQTGNEEERTFLPRIYRSYGLPHESKRDFLISRTPVRIRRIRKRYPTIC